MSPVFLSTEWFAAIEAVQPSADPAAARALNLEITGAPGGEDVSAHVVHDVFRRGHSSSAAATLTLPYRLAYSTFVKGQSRALMYSIIDDESWLDGDFGVLASLVQGDGNMLLAFPQRLGPHTAPLAAPTASPGPVADDPVSAEIDRLGLRPYAEQLDRDGYTIVPPDVTGVSMDLIDRLYERVLDLMEERNGVKPDPVTGETHRNVAVPSLYYFLFDDPIFEENLMSPHALALLEHLLGPDCVLSLAHLFVKGPADDPVRGALQLGLHCDVLAMHEEEPLPAEALFASCTWCLTDYSAELGGTVFVPGSHRERRMPVDLEGQDRFTVADTPRGSLMLWHGNTWHGSHPRSEPGLRIGLQWGFCRPGVARLQPFQADVTDEVLARNDARFGRLMGMAHIAGYRTEGPYLQAMMRAEAATKRRAAQTALAR